MMAVGPVMKAPTHTKQFMRYVFKSFPMQMDLRPIHLLLIYPWEAVNVN